MNKLQGGKMPNEAFFTKLTPTPAPPQDESFLFCKRTEFLHQSAVNAKRVKLNIFALQFAYLDAPYKHKLLTRKTILIRMIQ